MISIGKYRIKNVFNNVLVIYVEDEKGFTDHKAEFTLTAESVGKALEVYYTTSETEFHSATLGKETNFCRQGREFWFEAIDHVSWKLTLPAWAVQILFWFFVGQAQRSLS